MYYYYARTTVSKKPVWWKKCWCAERDLAPLSSLTRHRSTDLTTMQIAQFVIDLTVIYYIMYNAIVIRLELPFPSRGDCYGDLNAGYFGTAVISSYLLLFIDFFIRTYRKGGRAGVKKEKTENGQVAENGAKANGASASASAEGLRKRN